MDSASCEVMYGMPKYTKLLGKKRHTAPYIEDYTIHNGNICIRCWKPQSCCINDMHKPVYVYLGSVDTALYTLTFKVTNLCCN